MINDDLQLRLNERVKHLEENNKFLSHTEFSSIVILVCNLDYDLHASYFRRMNVANFCVLNAFCVPKSIQRKAQEVESSLQTTVLFQDLIQFLLDGTRNLNLNDSLLQSQMTISQNDHFDGPYENKCHLCIFNYDYIVKTETNDEDADFIINNKLKGWGSSISTNTHRASGSVLLREGRSLSKYYQNLSSVQYLKIIKRHEKDFGMFGYTFSDKFVAGCSEKVEGMECC